jgi:multidrug efflux system membrane fusion protein
MRRALGLVIALLVLGAIFYFVHPFGDSSSAQQRAQAQKAGDRAQPVVAAPVVQKPMPVQISTIGRAQTIANVAVRTRIDGVIASVKVTDGQEVKTGAVLFTLDDRQAQTQVNQAEATLARDKAQLEMAKRELNRLAPLAEKAYASRQQLDQAQATAASADATVRADQAALEAAKVQLSYTVIEAPIDGRLGTIAQKIGNSIKANDTNPLVTINQMRPIYVAFSVPQGWLGALQDATAAGPLAAVATRPGSDGAPEEGQVAYIENAVDATSNTISVKASFPNGQNRLWPGQFVNVTVTLRNEPQALVVPAAAVQTGQEGQYVFVIKDDSTVDMRPVAVDRTVGDEAVIAKGVAAGEQVVTQGQLRLEPGTKVEVKQPQNGAAKETPS